MEPLELTQAAEGGAPQPVAEESASQKRPVDFMQPAFWTLLLISIAAATVAIAWPGAGGVTAPLTLIAMGGGAMVGILWLARGAGRRLGLFPERGAAAAAIAEATPKFGWINALDEAVLVAERTGAPIAANAPYSELADLALGGLGDTSSGPVTVDRMFGASPGLAAPIYRLSRAAKAGEARREVLPPITLGPDALPAQYEIGVSPLPRGRVLWRLRRIAGSQEATGAADMKSLYVEDAPMGFFAAKPDGTITYANSWLRELLGLPETQAKIRIDDIMRPEFVKLLRRDRKSGAPGRADIMLRARDGVEVPVQTITTWHGRGVDAAGRTIVISNQQALFTSQERMTAQSASRPPRPDGDPMFDDAPFGAVRLEGDSVERAVIMDANRELMTMAEGRAAPGVRFADLFVAEDGEEQLKTELLDAIDKPVSLTLVGDEPKTVNVFVTLDGQGRPSAAYVIDITEQKQLELRLAQGEKMQAIGQLAGGLAHDFNNVLTVIILNAGKLMTRHPVGDPSYEELRLINEHAIRASELVQSLLAYSRKQTFKREIVDITDVLAETRRLLDHLLDERIELEVRHGRDLPKVKVDPHQLETSILNLATNARDAMLDPKKGKGGGTLTISTSRTTGEEAHKKGFGFVELGEYLLIEVADTGHGMSQDVMEKVFQPFFTTKESGSGTGLGLATVYGIIKQSGGYICPVSKVGEGATFGIYLPALGADELPQEEPEIAPSRAAKRPSDLAGRGRILLVEDEDGVRGIAASLLTTRGYDVVEAMNGELALELIQAEPGSFDLVISDVVMPGMDGPSLIKEARPLLGDARVIFISGYAERDLARALDEERAVSFLPKPFTVRQLAERVKEELTIKQDLDKDQNEAA